MRARGSSEVRQGTVRAARRGNIAALALALLAGAVASVTAACGDRDKQPKPKVQVSGAAMQADVRLAAAERPAGDLERLQREARRATDEARARVEQSLRGLTPRWSDAEAKLSRLRTRGGNALRAMREGCGKALAALQQAYREAREEFERG